MEFLSLFLHFGSVTCLLLLAVLDCRDCRNMTQRFIMTGMCVSIAAYVMSFSPDAMAMPDILRKIALYVHIPSMAFVWLFGLMLFEDGFEIRRHHIFLSLLYIIPAAIICVYYQDWHSIEATPARIMLHIYGLILMGHLTYRIIDGHKHDLIDRRRRVRLSFIGALVIVSIGMSLAETGQMPIPAPVLSWLKVIAIFTLSLWALLWLTRLDDRELSFEPETGPVSQPNAISLDPRDAALKTRLIVFMEQEKIYLEHGLTIRGLAEKLSTPEHRLRHVINKGLGYRNFAAFLNHYRIDAIKTAFGEPTNESLPILTIAMDYGYNSLAPFNRAFRASEGMTPSEYREMLLS